MKVLKLFELLFLSGALSAYVKWKIFSLSAFKIVKRLQYMGVKPSSIIDIGANVGQFSIAASEILKPEKLIVIEANMELKKELEKNLSYYQNKEIIFNGIGDFNGLLEFNLNIDSQTSSFLNLGSDRIREFPNNLYKSKNRIKVITLDKLMKKKFIPEPVLLKIDVQGYEKEVLNGAKQILSNFKWVVIETSFANLYEGEATFNTIVKLMSENNYTFVKPLNFHETKDKFNIIEMDALFENNKELN
ncbi:FkbM family methyltransferase [Alphaproteobacteria bacterium]|nr:FkbM family methyltransferase [Alphaproteobacteria bacterium]